MSWTTTITPATAIEFTDYWEPKNGSQPFILSVTGKPRLMIQIDRLNDVEYRGLFGTLWERVAFSEGYAFRYLTALYGGVSAIDTKWFIPGLSTEMIIKPKAWMYYSQVKLLEVN